MKTLIAYSSKYGCTKTCARLLASSLDAEVDMLNLKNEEKVDLTAYNAVIIGSPVYARKILSEVKKFTENYQDKLVHKQLGLFICAMQEKHMVMKELEENFPKPLLEVAVAKGCFGGEYHFDKMNIVEKMIIKKVAKVEEDLSQIQTKEILQFAEKMNEAEKFIIEK